jgi:hypothetical protein
MTFPLRSIQSLADLLYDIPLEIYPVFESKSDKDWIDLKGNVIEYVCQRLDRSQGECHKVSLLKTGHSP